MIYIYIYIYVCVCVCVCVLYVVIDYLFSPILLNHALWVLLLPLLSIFGCRCQRCYLMNLNCGETIHAAPTDKSMFIFSYVVRGNLTQLVIQICISVDSSVRTIFLSDTLIAKVLVSHV